MITLYTITHKSKNKSKTIMVSRQILLIKLISFLNHYDPTQATGQSVLQALDLINRIEKEKHTEEYGISFKTL